MISVSHYTVAPGHTDVYIFKFNKCATWKPFYDWPEYLCQENVL